jgi:hypothetical protein
MKECGEWSLGLDVEWLGDHTYGCSCKMGMPGIAARSRSFVRNAVQLCVRAAINCNESGFVRQLHP